MQAQKDLEKIEKSIEEAREQIILAEALTRLRNNVDFKLVFIDAYFHRNAVWLVGQKANPELQDELNQTYIDKQLNAIGHVNQYLKHILAQGVAASAQIDADEREREVILREAL